MVEVVSITDETNDSMGVPMLISSDEMVSQVLSGDKEALVAFRDRFYPLVLQMTRSLVPYANDEIAIALTRRALQRCVDELPNLPAAPSDSLLEGWVAVVSSRFLSSVDVGDCEVAQRARELLPPTLPSTKEFSLSVYHRPAELVSGDYFDAIVRDDQSLLLFVADVMGHGVPAGMVVSALKCAFRIACKSGDCEKILGEINLSLEEVLPESVSVVGAVVRLDGDAQENVLGNAGLEWAAAVRSGGTKVDMLVRPGLPLGIIQEAEFGLCQFALGEGDHVILCTDGVHDLLDSSGKPFGKVELEQVVLDAAKKGEDVKCRLVEALEKFCPNADWNDDACFLIATFQGSDGKEES